MPEVGVTLRAPRFRADHSITLICFGTHTVAIQWLIKAWPARPRIELCFRREQRLATTNAVIGAGVLRIPVFARERPLGSGLARHVILLRRQLLTPICFRFHYLLLYVLLRVFSHKSPND